MINYVFGVAREAFDFLCPHEVVRRSQKPVKKVSFSPSDRRREEVQVERSVAEIFLKRIYDVLDFVSKDNLPSNETVVLGVSSPFRIRLEEKKSFVLARTRLETVLQHSKGVVQSPDFDEPFSLPVVLQQMKEMGRLLEELREVNQFIRTDPVLKIVLIRTSLARELHPIGVQTLREEGVSRVLWRRGVMQEPCAVGETPLVSSCSQSWTGFE